MNEIDFKWILSQLQHKPKKMAHSWVADNGDLFIYLPPYLKRAKTDSKRIKRLKK